MNKAIRVIPATINQHTATPINEQRKRRTAGYARVSTDKDEQQNSYEAQVDYYTKYIQTREDWDFVTVYTDEGLSATSTAKRTGFNNMVADALAGKIDLIVTKSVSRFARNTVDSLSTIRKLKEKGVECYFEKENIWTFDGKGELLITIMSSLAQEESRSISENCTWGQRKRFADGKVTVPFSRFLGYDRGEDGNLVINEEQAVTVRLIYRMYLEGATPHTIARHLTSQGIPSPGGKPKWNSGTIKSILTNEKFKGDGHLQKTYTVCFLSKKKKRNEGEIPAYYVEGSHPAIIEPAVFDMVQQEMQKRKNGTNRHSGVGLFSSKIKCGECGSWYGSKVWHSSSKYRRTIYQCNGKFKGDKKCQTPHFNEDEIKTMFVTAVNKLLADKDDIIAAFDLVRDEIFNTATLEAERSTLQTDMAVTADMMQKAIEENARTAQDQDEYQRRYATLVERFETAKVRFEDVDGQIADKQSRLRSMEAFIAELAKADSMITEFDERLWHGLVDYATATLSKGVCFIFKNGMEMQV